METRNNLCIKGIYHTNLSYLPRRLCIYLLHRNCIRHPYASAVHKPSFTHPPSTQSGLLDIARYTYPGSPAFREGCVTLGSMIHRQTALLLSIEYAISQWKSSANQIARIHGFKASFACPLLVGVSLTSLAIGDFHPGTDTPIKGTLPKRWSALKRALLQLLY